MFVEASRMPGIDGQKMSKSYQNTIAMREDPASVEKKIRTMPTDPARVRRSDPRYVTDTRPPGIVAIASGGAAVVVGAVLLALDRRQRRPTVAVVPWLRRHGAGVGAVVRF